MNSRRYIRDEIHKLHAHICSGLADATRIEILYVLREQPYTVNRIVEALALPQPTVSRHLKNLRERGMVKAERRGQYVYYALKDQRIIEALDLLRAVMNDFLQERARLAQQQ